MIAGIALAARFMDVKIRRDAMGIDQMPGNDPGCVQPSGRAQFTREGEHEIAGRLGIGLEAVGIGPAFAVALPELGGVPQLRPVPRP